MSIVCLNLGFSVVLILIIWMLVELSMLLKTNLTFVLARFEKDENITPESRIYATRALTLGGLTFAALALLIGTFSDDIKDAENTLIILVYALSLLFCSYSMEILTNFNRIYWLLQEKFLNFGFLGLLFSLLAFFFEKMFFMLIIIIPIIIIIAIIHVLGFYTDYKHYSQRKKYQNEQKQLKKQPLQTQQTICSICGQTLIYYSQNNKYYCYQCKRYE